MIGISRDQWRLIAAAAALGGNVRAGLEDNFYLPDGEMARSNGDLIAKARRDRGERRPARGDRRGGARAARRMSALSDIRVLDLSRLLPGGFCSLLLADFGAEVLKVEDTGMGDYIRWSPPFYEGADESAKSALFLALNRGKRSIRLDLKSEAGREVLLRLVREYDVLLESFRPGVMERLGVGYERLREENPRLVYCAITGYGQDGPYTARSGHDMNYLGLNGVLGLSGDAGGPPVQPAGQIADLGGGALMARLRDPRRAARARAVGARASSWTSRCSTARSRGSRWWRRSTSPTAWCRGAATLALAGGLICYRPYACQRRLGHAGRARAEVLAGVVPRRGSRGPRREAVRARRGSDAHAEVERIFLERTRDEWQAFASEHDCCLEPVLGLDEALDSELVRAREMVVELDQPGAESEVRLLGVPVKLSRTPGAPAGPGPALGEHTRRGAGVARLLARTRSPRCSRRVPWAGPAERLEGLVPGLGVATFRVLRVEPERYPDFGEGESADEAFACPIDPVLVRRLLGPERGHRGRTVVQPGASGIGDPYFPLEGNGGYDVQHYDLTFSYDPATDELDAVNKITATANQGLSRFDLDLQQLTVDSVDVNGHLRPSRATARSWSSRRLRASRTGRRSR